MRGREASPAGRGRKDRALRSFVPFARTLLWNVSREEREEAKNAKFLDHDDIGLNYTVALSLSKGAYRLDTLRQAQGYGII